MHLDLREDAFSFYILWENKNKRFLQTESYLSKMEWNNHIK